MLIKDLYFPRPFIVSKIPNLLDLSSTEEERMLQIYNSAHRWKRLLELSYLRFPFFTVEN